MSFGLVEGSPTRNVCMFSAGWFQRFCFWAILILRFWEDEHIFRETYFCKWVETTTI